MRLMDDIDALLVALNRSRFRQRFALGGRERALLGRHGLARILSDGEALLRHRLAPASPTDDGRQTPMRGHPIFIAQHATATCCRGCLSTWHAIPEGQPLSEHELAYVLRVIERWLQREPAAHRDPAQPSLFGETK